MTTIGLTLYISALPVADRIKALKEAAEAGSFSFYLVISFAYKKRCAVSSIMPSCPVSVIKEVCHVFITGRTHLLNYYKIYIKYKKLFLRYLPPPINLHSIPYMKKKDHIFMKILQDVRACKS